MDYIEFESVWQFCKAFSIYQDSSLYNGRIPDNPFEFAEPDDIMAAIGDTLKKARYTRYLSSEESAARADNALTQTQKNAAGSTVYFDSLTDSTALITITTFYSDMVYNDFLQCITGASRFTNFIFDVRHNGGGYLDLLDSIVEAVVPAGTPYILARERDFDTVAKKYVTRDWHQRITRQGSLLPFQNKRVAVIMDTLSASASEIFAAAMYEGMRARLIGTRSYGKGIGQAQLVRRTRKMLLITFLQLRGVSSRIGDYHRHGIVPDTVPSSVATEGDSLDWVNRPIFYAVKIFEPKATPNGIAFPPSRIPSGSLARVSGLRKVVSEDDVHLPGAP